jgi:hypothetical protein
MKREEDKQTRSQSELIQNFDSLIDNYQRAIGMLLEGLRPGFPQTKRNGLIDAFKPLANKNKRTE